MEENSKDAEVRARVTGDMLKGLTAIANARGEQLPVIVREALMEYLAKRAATSGSKYPAPGTAALLQTLQDQPEVANTLIALGRLLSAGPKPGAPEAEVDYGKKRRRKPSK